MSSRGHRNSLEKYESSLSNSAASLKLPRTEMTLNTLNLRKLEEHIAILSHQGVQLLSQNNC